MTVQGADWAHWQGSVDIQGMYAKGMRFGIIKATDGTSYSYADSWYVPQMKRLLAVPGVIPGTYHMLIHNEDPVSQANYFGRYIGMYPPVQIVALDFEFNELRRTKPTDGECRSFAARINTMFPNKSKWLYALESDVHRLKGYPEFQTWVRWIAKYASTPPTGYDVWQYGQWQGLDGDRYPGTLAEFKKLVGEEEEEMTLDEIAKGFGFKDAKNMTVRLDFLKGEQDFANGKPKDPNWPAARKDGWDHAHVSP